MAYQSKSYRKFVAGALSAAVVASSVAPVAASAAENKFTDVDANAWYAEAVNTLAEQGYIKGIGEGKFGPNNPLQRQDAAVLFARILDLDTTKAPDPGFKDVVKGSYYYDAVAAMKQEGYFKGITEDTFGVNTTLTRGQMAVTILRVLDIEPKAEKTPFTDVDKNAYYADAVATAYKHGLIKGTSATTYEPDKHVTRAEFAQFIYNVMNQLSPSLSDVTATADGQKVTVTGKAANIDQVKVEVFAKDDTTKAVASENITVKDGQFTFKSGELKDGEYVAKVTADGVDAKEVSFKIPSATTPTNPGTVEVSSSFTPSQSVAKGQALFEVAKVNVKAGSDGAVVKGIKLNRGGLSKDADIDSISIWDGTKRLNVPAVLSNNKAEINFTRPLVLKANEAKELQVKINVANDATVSSQIQITLPADGLITDGKVSGTVAGASGSFTISDVTLAKATAKKSPSAPTQILKPGKDNQALGEWEVEVNNEPVKFSSLTLTQDGSAGDGDLKNLKLYKDGKQVGTTVESLDSRTVTFVFKDGLLVDKGEKVRLQLRGDVVGGSTRDVQFKIDNDSDLIGTDQTYGTSITLPKDQDRVIGSDKLTIDEGNLLVSRDPESPVSTKVDFKAKDHVFTSVRVESVGEATQLRKVKLLVKTSGNAKPSELENVKLLVNGKTIGEKAKPFEGKTDANGNAEYELTLSNPLDLKSGEKAKIDIQADLKNDPKAGAKYEVGLNVTDAMGTLSGRKLKQENLGGNVYGLPMEVGAVAVTVSDAPQKADFTTKDGVKQKFIFQNQADVVLKELNIQHDFLQTLSVYNVKLDIPNGAKNIRNIKLVNEKGEVISDSINNPSATNNVLTLNEPVDVKSGEVVKVKVIGDIASDASDVTNINVSGDSVVRYKNSGEQVTTVKYNNADALQLAVESGKDAEIEPGRSVKADLDPVNVTQRGVKDATVAAFTLKETSAVQSGLIDKMVLKAELGKADDTVGKADPSVKDFGIKAEKAAEAKDFTNIRIVDKDGKVYGTAPNFVDGKAEITFSTPFEVVRDDDVELYVQADVAGNAEYGGTVKVGIDKYEFTNKSTGERRVKEDVNVDSEALFLTTATNIVPEAKAINTNIDSYAGVKLAEFDLPNKGTNDIAVKQVQLIDKGASLKGTGAVLAVKDGEGKVLATFNVDGPLAKADDAGNTVYTIPFKDGVDRRIDKNKTKQIVVDIKEVGNLVERSVQLELGQWGTLYQRVTENKGMFPLDDKATAKSVVLQRADKGTYGPREAKDTDEWYKGAGSVTPDPGEVTKADVEAAIAAVKVADIDAATSLDALKPVEAALKTAQEKVAAYKGADKATFEGQVKDLQAKIDAKKAALGGEVVKTAKDLNAELSEIIPGFGIYNVKINLADAQAATLNAPVTKDSTLVLTFADGTKAEAQYDKDNGLEFTFLGVQGHTVDQINAATVTVK